MSVCGCWVSPEGRSASRLELVALNRRTHLKFPDPLEEASWSLKVLAFTEVKSPVLSHWVSGVRLSLNGDLGNTVLRYVFRELRPTPCLEQTSAKLHPQIMSPLAEPQRGE